MIKTKFHRTKCGFFAPFDFETYKKIKKIKATYNISTINAARYKKWARKLEKNRTKPSPVLCESFHTPTFCMDYHISWDRQKFQYTKINFKVEYAKSTELSKQITELWEYAKAKESPEKIGNEPDCLKNLNIDEIYQECLLWRK